MAPSLREAPPGPRVSHAGSVSGEISGLKRTKSERSLQITNNLKITLNDINQMLHISSCTILNAWYCLHVVFTKK